MIFLTSWMLKCCKGYSICRNRGGILACTVVDFVISITAHSVYWMAQKLHLMGKEWNLSLHSGRFCYFDHSSQCVLDSSETPFVGKGVEYRPAQWSICHFNQGIGWPKKFHGEGNRPAQWSICISTKV